MTTTTDDRLARARLSLEGLSVGDAFGERFFGPARAIQARLASRDLPPGPWRFTDDTEMSLAVVEVLAAHGGVDPDALARGFARRHAADPGRGYGRAVRDTLEALGRGEAWQAAAARPFGGLGDTDTVSAIVGGIVVLATGLDGIPAAWRRAREPLDR